MKQPDQHLRTAIIDLALAMLWLVITLSHILTDSVAWLTVISAAACVLFLLGAASSFRKWKKKQQE